MGEKIKKFLKNSIGYIMALLLTAAYITLSFMTINRTGRTVEEIVGTSFVFYLYQIALVSLFRPQGIANGERNPKYVKTQELHAKKVDEVADHMDELSVWAEKENEKNYKVVRKRILAGAGLKYDDYFKADGIIEPYKIDPKKLSLRWSNRFMRKEEKRRIKAYKRAVRLKLSEIDATSLTSCDRAKEDKYALPESKKEFMGRNTLKSIVTKAFPAILFGLYGFKEIEDWTWINLAWTSFQAISGFASAIPEMLAAQSYVVDDLRLGAVKKISWLDAFLCALKLAPEEYSTQKEESIKEKDDECDKCKNTEICQKETADGV